MAVREEDLAQQHLGKILLFLFVGALSALLLYVGWHSVTRDEPMGYWPLPGAPSSGGPCSAWGGTMPGSGNGSRNKPLKKGLHDPPPAAIVSAL